MVLTDRAMATTTGTGTGSLTFSVSSGFQAPTSGQEAAYCIYDSANNWEVGVAMVSGTTLQRSYTPFYSSNAGALVNFGSGTKTVVFGLAASSAVFCGRHPADLPWVAPVATGSAIAGGNGSSASGGGVALGRNAIGNSGSVAIGTDVKANYGDFPGIVIGYNLISPSGATGIAIGSNINFTNALNSLAMGNDIVLGDQYSYDINDAIAIGNRSFAYTSKAIAIGPDTQSWGGIAVGNGAIADGYSAAFGKVRCIDHGMIGWSNMSPPATSGQTQAAAYTVTKVRTTYEGANDTVFVTATPAGTAGAFFIDAVGQSNDANNNVVAVRITGCHSAAALVGTPTVTVLGRSAGFASTVTASVSLVNGALRVNLTASATIQINWSIVARLSMHDQIV